ncbi:MAG: CinA family protein [Alphaproteobacteria bacterium]|nr:CinA family protein [Alphaproteobacteria bacterium]
MAAKDVLDVCRENHWKVATAESCTGGLIAAVLTEIAGSSDVVDRGFVTYSNEAKAELLGVPVELIESDGAVSERVARAMAEGALERSNASIAISCTGVAGPGGGSDEKPVGLVHMAVARDDGPTVHERCLFADNGRASIREATVVTGFEMIKSMAAKPMIA